MDVIVAKKAGFCFGVKRAMNISEKAADENEKPIRTHGQVVHNPQAIERLKELGVEPIKDLKEMDSGTLIIRAHGVPPEVYKEAERKKLKMLDATCPFVKRAQDYAKTLSEEGYSVVIIGEKDHPEVKGIKGHAGLKAVVIETVEEAEAIPFSAKIGVAIQTTQDKELVKKLLCVLLDKTKELRVFNTICSATQERQAAVRELSETADVIIVVGGKNSGNTQRLHQIASGKVPAYHIERPEEIKQEWLKGAKLVGVTAGASTPDFVIMDVVSHLKGSSTYETAIAVFVEDGKVLLEERDVTRKIYPHTWLFPGGFVHEGEKPDGAIKRRMKEELGVEITKTSPILVIEDKKATPGKTYKHTLYLVEWTGKVACRHQQKLEWFASNELPKNKLPPIFAEKLGEIIEAINANA
ncbi:MAG: 4-hydroxy-3-methylbut-2-enyl diphosphate reductase [Candidatus Micrarchaeota archaeon]